MGVNRVQDEVLCALRQLKWVVAALSLGGLRDFPASRVDLERNVPGVVGESGASPKLADGGHSIEERDPEQALQSILAEMGDCKRCRLHTGRKNLVFADGSPLARLVFVGEGPGFDEDRQGLPFVGRAGKLLDKMINALGLQRGEVYICNVVKCRPPNNRTPDADEIELCSPFLFRQLNAVRPQVICALGACAAQTLLGNSNPISRLRGKVHYWRGIPLVCTFHPAYLLRNPAQKAAAWQDLLELRELLHRDA